MDDFAQGARGKLGRFCSPISLWFPARVDIADVVGKPFTFSNQGREDVVIVYCREIDLCRSAAAGTRKRIRFTGIPSQEI